MSAPATPSARIHVVITHTGSDLRHIASFATRRTRLLSFVGGSLLLLATTLSFSDGDGAPFLVGLLTGWLGATLLVASLLLPPWAARRMPRFVTEPRTCEIDDQRIRLRGSTWAEECAWEAFRRASLSRHLIVLHREHYALSFVLPRAAFAGEPEAELVRILRERRLLP